MKNILTKVGYMAFGGLLTLIGCYFGNSEILITTALMHKESIEKTHQFLPNSGAAGSSSSMTTTHLVLF